uniref:Uncharacterized protein n=1 Tax=Triticum urartu TaxID=4572 RepID=A0A8R7QLD3_TRIUA
MMSVLLSLFSLDIKISGALLVFHIYFPFQLFKPMNNILFH